MAFKFRHARTLRFPKTYRPQTLQLCPQGETYIYDDTLWFDKFNS